MAYLNVRERRLETKIAYIGAEFSGRATNFQKLGGDAITDSGDGLALFWTPLAPTSFRDCDVRAELVTSHGEPSGEEIIDLVRGADGVVFVADADPSAQDRNRVSLAMVRDALSTQVDRQVPVVVQVNKTDLPDALGESALAELLGLGDWTRVSACATRGEGVVETATEVLAKVLDVLRQDLPGAASAPANAHTNGAGRMPTVRPGSNHTLPREGNPLLTALRQVLRETVNAEVTAQEERTQATLERMFAQVTTQVTAQVTGQVTGQVTEQLTAQLERRAENEEKLHREIAQLKEQLAAMDTRAERAALATTAVKRSVEILAADVKGSDPRPQLTPIKSALDAVVLQMASLTSLVKPVQALAPRLEEIEGQLKREIMGRGSLAVRTVEMKHEESTATLAKLESKLAAKHDELAALFQSVIEELKKPKKGWFT